MTIQQPANDNATTSDTRLRILSTAEALVRTRGYYGFSFAHIADAIGLTKASIHHHFKTKENLGCALITTTKDLMESEISQASDQTTIGLLRLYIGFFKKSIEGNLVCLCGMLIAEDQGLPEQIRTTNREFADWQVNWLAQILEEGRNAGEVQFHGTPTEQANFIYSLIQGAHAIAKFQDDLTSFMRMMDQLLAQLSCNRL